jgi:LytS/YehU family sensor histidine kinase
MLLQPCVENAVKHGIRNLAAGGCVTLRAWVREDWLYVVIENPVAPDLSSSESTGTGLSNIKRRLVTLYGDRARALWTRDAERFTVEIVIPVGEEG